ncbi:MAG: type II secretion system protein GspG [Vicinamibacterales bacterium]|nr:type II secretion system protein GspG [Vicinamibacterales bacterium]
MRVGRSSLVNIEDADQAGEGQTSQQRVVGFRQVPMATSTPSRRPIGTVNPMAWWTGGSTGFSLIEVLVVVAVAVILALTVGPIAFTWIDQGRAARAQGDANAMSAAMNRFFQDTTRWPGQVEILKPNSVIRFLIVGNPSVVTFPIFAVPTGIGPATCSSGLSGVTPNVTAFSAATPSPSNSLNVIDFLTKPPPVSDYPNWRGPYLSVNLSSDPWGRPYVINIIPLFCAETVTGAAPGGALGFGWILSGGPNRTIQTRFTDFQAAADADDVGTNLNKLMTRSLTP